MEQSDPRGGNMAISIKRRQKRLKRMLLERSQEMKLETNLRHELANRMKEGPTLFASARDEGDFGFFGLNKKSAGAG
jgi:hypothetical protein